MGSYLGQNFLKDIKYISYIVEKISDIKNKYGMTTLFEIGPGKGAISKKEVNLGFDQIVLFEKDKTFSPILTQLENTGGKIDIQWGDVLEQDIQKIENKYQIDGRKTLIVGNLPYYITSPILRMFFGNGKNDFGCGLFMVQDEVGQKLKHDANKKSYLWWLLNFAYEVSYCKMVPAKAFNPPPKVKSCIIQLNKKDNPPSFSFERMINFLELFSPYSRKTLGAIQKLISKRGEESYFFIPEHLTKNRLEELDWSELKEILEFSGNGKVDH